MNVSNFFSKNIKPRKPSFAVLKYQTDQWKITDKFDK